jgi:hypothetical protein
MGSYSTTTRGDLRVSLESADFELRGVVMLGSMQGCCGQTDIRHLLDSEPSKVSGLRRDEVRVTFVIGRGRYRIAGVEGRS